MSLFKPTLLFEKNHLIIASTSNSINHFSTNGWIALTSFTICFFAHFLSPGVAVSMGQ